MPEPSFNMSRTSLIPVFECSFGGFDFGSDLEHGRTRHWLAPSWLYSDQRIWWPPCPASCTLILSPLLFVQVNLFPENPKSVTRDSWFPSRRVAAADSTSNATQSTSLFFSVFILLCPIKQDSFVDCDVPGSLDNTYRHDSPISWLFHASLTFRAWGLD